MCFNLYFPLYPQVHILPIPRLPWFLIVLRDIRKPSKVIRHSFWFEGRKLFIAKQRQWITRLHMYVRTIYISTMPRSNLHLQSCDRWMLRHQSIHLMLFLLIWSLMNCVIVGGHDGSIAHNCQIRHNSYFSRHLNYIHCMRIVWVLHAYCMSIVCVLYEYCMRIVWVLYAYCVSIVCVLYSHVSSEE